MFVKINGNRLRLEVMGKEGLPVLIALHGGGGIGSLREPKSTFGFLSDRFQVVTFDMRGCGESEGRAPISHAQWVADVEGIRDWLGTDRVVLAGGSYGGFIAMEYAIAHAGRLVAMVLRDTAPDSSNLALGRANAQAQSRVPINWANFDRYWGGRIRDNDDLRSCWAELIPLYSVRSTARGVEEQVSQTVFRYETHNWCMQNRPNYDVKAGLGSVSCPTLVLVGRHDWTTPVCCSETITSLLPNARLVIFENSGHSPQVEERDLFRETVGEFLSAVLEGRAFS